MGFSDTDDADDQCNLKRKKRISTPLMMGSLYDRNSPLFNLMGIRTEVVGGIIWENWKKLVENWQIYSPNAMSPCWVAYTGLSGSSLIYMAIHVIQLLEYVIPPPPAPP